MTSLAISDRRAANRRALDPCARGFTLIELLITVSVLALLAGGAMSFASLAAIPPDGFHPLAQLACLLPLQLAALFVVFSRPQNG